LLCLYSNSVHHHLNSRSLSDSHHHYACAMKIQPENLSTYPLAHNQILQSWYPSFRDHLSTYKYLRLPLHFLDALIRRTSGQYQSDGSSIDRAYRMNTARTDDTPGVYAHRIFQMACSSESVSNPYLPPAF